MTASSADRSDIEYYIKNLAIDLSLDIGDINRMISNHSLVSGSFEKIIEQFLIQCSLLQPNRVSFHQNYFRTKNYDSSFNGVTWVATEI